MFLIRSNLCLCFLLGQICVYVSYYVKFVSMPLIMSNLCLCCLSFLIRVYVSHYVKFVSMFLIMSNLCLCFLLCQICVYVAYYVKFVSLPFIMWNLCLCFLLWHFSFHLKHCRLMIRGKAEEKLHASLTSVKVLWIPFETLNFAPHKNRFSNIKLLTLFAVTIAILPHTKTAFLTSNV